MWGLDHELMWACRSRLLTSYHGRPRLTELLLLMLTAGFRREERVGEQNSLSGPRLVPWGDSISRVSAIFLFAVFSLLWRGDLEVDSGPGPPEGAWRMRFTGLVLFLPLSSGPEFCVFRLGFLGFAMGYRSFRVIRN